MFNGQVTVKNALIKQNMEMELKRSHYYGMTQVDIFSEAPDPHPKTSSHFISAMAFRHPGTNEFILHATGHPMTLDEIRDYDLPAHDEMIAAALVDRPPDGVPEAVQLYNGDLGERRAQYKDYTSDQRFIKLNYDDTKKNVTGFFTIMDSHCTDTGRDTYREHLPGQHTVGNPRLAWRTMEVAMGINADTGLSQMMTQFMSVKIPSGGSLPDFFRELVSCERMMAAVGHPLSEVISKAQIEKRIRAWQNQSTSPYQNVLDSLLVRPDMTLLDFKELILKKEAMMLQQGPKTSSGRNPREAMASEERRFKAYRTEGDSSDEEDMSRAMVVYAAPERSMVVYTPPEEPRRAAASVSFAGRCGLCKAVGHVSRDCPYGWFCDKCKWMHHKNDLCDQGAAKRAWKIAIDEKEKKGVGALKAGGGGTSSN